jgi:hypothetical protein
MFLPLSAEWQALGPLVYGSPAGNRCDHMASIVVVCHPLAGRIL